MFLRAIFFAAIILFGSAAMAGEGRLSRSFPVRSDIQTVADWLNSHHDEVARSTHCRIISRRGNLVRVARNTMKGEFEFTLRETITEGKDSGTYRMDLVESHKGRLTHERTVVTFTKSGSGTSISIYAEAVVDDPRIRNPAVIAGLSTSVRGFERMMLSRF